MEERYMFYVKGVNNMAEKRVFKSEKPNLFTPFQKEEWNKICEQLRNSGVDLSKIKIAKA